MAPLLYPFFIFRCFSATLGYVSHWSHSSHPTMRHRDTVMSPKDDDSEKKRDAARWRQRKSRAKKRAREDAAAGRTAKATESVLKLVDDLDSAPELQRIAIPESLLSDEPDPTDVSRLTTALLQRLLEGTDREIERARVGATLLRLLADVSKDLQAARVDTELLRRLEAIEDSLAG